MSSKELLFKTFGESYELIGKLRFRRFRDLLSAEAAGIERLERETMQFQLQGLLLARKISEAKGIPVMEVLNSMQGIGKADDVEQSLILADYAEEMQMMIAMMPSQTRLEDELVTIAIQSRAEIRVDGAWQRIDDWDLADSQRLPTKFKAQISEFIRREQAGEDGDGRRRGKALKEAEPVESA